MSNCHNLTPDCQGPWAPVQKGDGIIVCAKCAHEYNEAVSNGEIEDHVNRCGQEGDGAFLLLEVETAPN